MNVLRKLMFASLALGLLNDEARATDYYLDYDQSIVAVCIAETGSDGAITKPVLDCLERRTGRTSSKPVILKDEYIPVKEQRRVIFDCRSELGLTGAAVFGGTWPEIPPGGQTYVKIMPSANLSTADANWINACADQRLGRAHEPLQAQSHRTGPCFEGAPVLLGGSTYCIGSR